MVSGNEWYLLAFLDGDFQSVVKYGMNVQSALGWSSTFMKIGIAWFLLYLYRGEELSTGCKSMCRFAAEAAGFTAEKYMRGLAEPADISAFSLFWDRFSRWKQMVSMPEKEQEQILKQLDQWIRLRVDGIMQGNYRKHYGECASFIAALGEVKESRGKAGEKERLLESYKAAYSRRTAFHKELRAFGMKA